MDLPFAIPGNGENWQNALDICRSEPGIEPDLASLNSPEEQGKHMCGYNKGQQTVAHFLYRMF